MTETELKFWGAIATAIASLIVAIVTHFSNRSNQREIEKLKGEIADSNAERDARRDYQYEARKRLYEQCGPLLFQLSEAAEAAYHRVLSLASRAREGNLTPGTTSFLSDSYFLLSTLYRLFAPAAVLKLIQQRLTLVDLSLDRTIHRQYTLAREAFFIFGEEFRLAQLAGLTYKPFAEKVDDLARKEPALYTRQGLPLGIIETVLEALIDAQKGRVLSYAECEEEYRKSGSKVRKTFDDVEFLVHNFHPQHRPVFWQMLVTQACIYRILSNPYDLETPQWSWEQLTKLSRAEVEALHWQEVSTELPPSLVAAERYYSERLAPRLRRVDALSAESESIGNRHAT